MSAEKMRREIATPFLGANAVRELRSQRKQRQGLRARNAGSWGDAVGGAWVEAGNDQVTPRRLASSFSFRMAARSGTLAFSGISLRQLIMVAAASQRSTISRTPRTWVA